MTVTPFTFGKIDPVEDYDDVIDRLNTWLNKVTPLYLSSPEYKALSKANQKGKGEWFGFFMELNIGYKSTPLAKIDAADVWEIMECLFPRKLICSDAQVKAIVPELIAFWQFLRRECGDKELKHAADIIEYLESIKKGYLKMFKGGDGSVQEDLLMSLLDQFENVTGGENNNFIPWVDDLIDQVVAEHRKKGEPAFSSRWNNQLIDPTRVSQVVQHICLNDLQSKVADDQDNIVLMESLRTIAIAAFQNLIILVRNKDELATEILQSLEHNLMEAAEHGVLNPMGTRLIAQTLSDHRAFLSPQFLQFLKQWCVDSSHSQMALSSQTIDQSPPDALLQILHKVADEAPDEFLFVSFFQDMLGMVPTDALAGLFEMLAETGDIRFGNMLGLYALDTEQEVALSAVTALVKHPACVGAVALNRLVRMRNWITDPVQKEMDKLIQTVRKRGVMPADPERKLEVVEAWMSAIDGVGSQGIWLLLQGVSGFQLSGCVLKENAGVVDTFVSPPESKSRIQAIMRQTTSETKMEKVSLDVVCALLPNFLAKHKESKLPIDVSLVQIFEILEIKDWNPRSCRLETLLFPELLVAPEDAEIERVQKSSKRWTTSAIGRFWFDESPAIARICFGSYGKNAIEAICREVLEPKRSYWQERMLRMALWAAHSHNKKTQAKAREFAVVWHLLNSSRPISDIALMQSVAKNSLDFAACNMP